MLRYDGLGSVGWGQVTQYFNFLIFLLANNFLMTTWSLVGWVPHAINVWRRLRADGVEDLRALGRSGAAEIMFLSSFQPSSDKMFDLMMYLGIATMLVTGPCYYIVAKL
jgi:hypothetical protein